MNVMKVALAGDALGDYIFGLDPQLLVDAVITMVAMFALFVLLSYLLFNPARELLQKRQDGIQEKMETAAKEKEQAIQFKEEYDAKLKGVGKEAEEILAQTRKKAQKKGCCRHTGLQHPPNYPARPPWRRRRFSASSFTSSTTTAISGMKNRIPIIPKSFPPIIAAISVYSGGSPTEPPTTLG